MSANVEAVEMLPCPFCGERLICDPNEGAPFWVHRNRIKSDCWLADSWVKDEAEGEGGILEWNTLALSRPSPAPSEQSEVVVFHDSANSHVFDDRIEVSGQCIAFASEPWTSRIAAALQPLALTDREAIARTVEQAVAQHKWAADDGYRRGLEDAAKVAREIADRYAYSTGRGAENRRWAAKEIASSILALKGDGR